MLLIFVLLNFTFLQKKSIIMADVPILHPPIYELMIKTKSNYMAMLFIDIYPVVNN